jgi:hypothetical protein
VTRAQIIQELADLEARIAAGTIDVGAATPRRRALERRLAEASA